MNDRLWFIGISGCQEEQWPMEGVEPIVDGIVRIDMAYKGKDNANAQRSCSIILTL